MGCKDTGCECKKAIDILSGDFIVLYASKTYLPWCKIDALYNVSVTMSWNVAISHEVRVFWGQHTLGLPQKSAVVAD